MKKLILMLWLALASLSCFAQNGNNYAKGFAYIGTLAGIPATCSVGQIAFISDATAGQNIYECTATNTWTQSGGGASFPLTSPTANPASAGSLRLANNTDKIEWNNAAGNANLAIYFDASNVFQIPGTLNVGSLTTGGTGADVYTAVADPAASLGEFWLSSTLTGRWKYSDASAIHTIVGADSTDTLTNKSIAASEINSGTLAVAQGGTNLASGTSGGILGYTASGTIASSGALTVNVLVKGGGAGATPTNSSITDNGTTVSTAEPISTTAAGAGAFVATAGTAQGHATASTVTLEAPAAVTAYEALLPAAAANGIPRWANAASVVTESVSELSGDCATSGSNAVICTQINGANFAVNSSGLPTKVDGITTAGQGVDIVQCITSAKVETAADASVLSCTPASAVGGYEVCISIDVSAANTATLGWTATWTNTKTNANAPTNLSLFQMGVAAPALTFTAAANNSYYSCVPIGVSNAGTAIVVKTTFSGTSIAYNVSAWVKRAI